MDGWDPPADPEKTTLLGLAGLAGEVLKTSESRGSPRERGACRRTPRVAKDVTPFASTILAFAETLNPGPEDPSTLHEVQVRSPLGVFGR